VVEEDLVVRRLMHSCAPFWDSTMLVFLVPLSKRCTRAQTIGKIFTSIEVHDVNIPDIVMVVLCKTVPAKLCIFMVVSNSYTKITFLPKGPLQTYVSKASIRAPAVCGATKTQSNSQIHKRRHLKKLFPPVCLHICVSVSELKKSQPYCINRSS
jgi:hypothetical protein